MKMDNKHQVQKDIQQPNVVMIVAHDMGNYLGCYGCNVDTPNIDRLAAQGVRFDNHFAVSPFCSPSRGGIITGKYPHTNGLMGLVNLDWDMPHCNITDAQWFASAGYRTWLVGFQHEKKDATKLGFHHVVEIDPDMSPERKNKLKSLKESPCGKVSEKAVEVLRAISGRDKVILNTYGQDGRKEEFEVQNDRRPFYIRIGTDEVHRIQYKSHEEKEYYYGYDMYYEEGTPESECSLYPIWKDTPALRKELRGFAGAVKRFDDAVGAVMRELDECGLADNTIIVVTTDHGIDFPRSKAMLYDTGIKTALILRGPGYFPSGKVISCLTSNIDVLPTLLEACNIRNTGMEGISLLPLVNGTSDKVRDEIFAEESTYMDNLMRCIRTERYKLIHNFVTNTDCPDNPYTWAHHHGRIQEEAEEYYHTVRTEYELYDIIDDPWEKKNLADCPEYADIKKSLNSKLNSWLVSGNDPVITGKWKRPRDEAWIIFNIFGPKRVRYMSKL